ncbi:MAG TPA: hypothetical protein VM933_11360 [Acidimicrobiales bacterium]|nr:hypothetical protein [Acidimicrobiales bacterium]
MTVGVVAGCGLLVVLGAALAVRWGHLDVVPPWRRGGAVAGNGSGESVGAGERVRRLAWFLEVHLLSAVVAGLLVVGPGGRLVMRLLAVTAGQEAQGRVTEADQRVGEITVGGTIGLVVFSGMFGAGAIALVLGALRKWLPPGRWGALAAAGLLLVAFATRVDPLRPDNPDFGIVGPGWVAVVAFVALAVLGALSLAAVAGRLSRSLPVLDGSVRTGLLYVPALLLLPITGVVFLAIVVVGGLGVVALSSESVRRVWADRRIVTAGRIALAVVGAAVLPGFLSDLAEIL